MNTNDMIPVKLVDLDGRIVKELLVYPVAFIPGDEIAFYEKTGDPQCWEVVKTIRKFSTADYERPIESLSITVVVKECG